MANDFAWLDDEPTAAELFFDDIERRHLISPPADLLVREFPVRDYAIEPYYPAKCCSTMIAEGGTGKSTEALKQCLHVAAGLPLYGLNVKQGTAVYYSVEDEPTEVWRRVQRIVRRMPVEAQQRALDNFVLIDRVGRRPYFVITTNGGTATITKTVDKLGSYIARYLTDVRLIVVDTISRVNGASENGNESMACVVDAGERIAQATGAAVVLLHHTSKAGARDGIDDLHAGRGGSALGDNCRSVLRLMPAQESHCRGFDISPEVRERGDVLRLVHAKCNYARKADPLWLRRLFDGALEDFEPVKVDATRRAEQKLQVFVQWAAEQTAPFSKRNVRSTEVRAEIWGDDKVSQHAASELYERAIREALIVDDPNAKSGGSPKQVISPATAERIVAEARAIADRFDIEDES